MALTPAQKAARRRRRQQERQQRRLNPLTAPFKTPAQLRAEAQRMADLSVVGEDVLREEQRRQESGLGALSGTLGGVLGGYQQQVAGGLAGLGALYGDIAGQARTAGGEALAAAGVAPGDAPAVSPTVASQFANIGALTSGYVPAAVTTGQRLIGESKASLTKALADRASSVSQNMAKFLQDLQQREYEKAVAQEVNRQNLSRLGLQAQKQESDDQYRSIRLGQYERGLNIQAQRVANAAFNAANRVAQKEQDANKKKTTKIRTLQEELVSRSGQLLAPGQYPGNNFKFEVTYAKPGSAPGDIPTIEKVTVVAADEAAAQAEFKRLYPGLPAPSDVIRGTQQTEYRAPTRREVIDELVPRLVKAGMRRNAARRFVINRILPQLTNTSGAFLGGVGGGA